MKSITPLSSSRISFLNGSKWILLLSLLVGWHFSDSIAQDNWCLKYVLSNQQVGDQIKFSSTKILKSNPQLLQAKTRLGISETSALLLVPEVPNIAFSPSLNRKTVSTLIYCLAGGVGLGVVSSLIGSVLKREPVGPALLAGTLVGAGIGGLYWAVAF